MVPPRRTMRPCVRSCMCALLFAHVNGNDSSSVTQAALRDPALCSVCVSCGCMYATCASHSHMVAWHRTQRMTPGRTQCLDLPQAAAAVEHCIELVSWMNLRCLRWITRLSVWNVFLHRCLSESLIALGYNLFKVLWFSLSSVTPVKGFSFHVAEVRCFLYY